MMGKRKISVIFLIFFGVLFVCVDVANGWKLRDLTQKDENKVTPKRQVFRDLPMSKLDSAIDDGDTDDDDDQTKVVVDENFVFEKVHSTHFDLPPPRADGESAPSDDEDNDDENADDSDEDEESDANDSENENETEESKDEHKESDSPSILSTVLKIPLNIFGVDKKSDDSKAADPETESGFFSWFSGFRKDEKKETKDAADEASDPNALSNIDWFSYLDRKPFNLILKYIRSDDNDSNDDDDNDKNDNSKAIKEREPIATEHFEHLLLNLPSFVPNYSKIDDVDCKRMGQIFQRQIRGQKMWALQSKMILINIVSV